MIAKRMRLKVIDRNGIFATIAMPVDVNVDDALAMSFATLYNDCTGTALRELNLIRVVHRYTSPSFGTVTPTVDDVASMLFYSHGPFGLRVPLLGPGNVFEVDDVTIDVLDPRIIALKDWILQWGRDRGGLALTAFKGGYRNAGA